jgi:GTP-binding protein Era
VPISAADGTGVDRLEEVILGCLPAGPPLYPPGTVTDQPETFFVAETIREKLLLAMRQEVPYACAVRVEELAERGPDAPLYIRGEIFVERPSQKAIVIGEGGAALKRVGQAARRELEAFFGVRVFLDLRVRVRRDWRQDDRALRELGYQLTS